MFDPLQVTIVSPSVSPAPESSVAEAEVALNVKFPDGYREYVTALGSGILSDFIRVYPPNAVVKDLSTFRERVNEYFFWDASADLLPKSRILECIWIADTINGDEVIFHPSDSHKLYLLPHDTEEIVELGPTLNDAIEWLLDQVGLIAEGTVIRFDRGDRQHLISLIPIEKLPRLADLKKRILKLQLHDLVEESKQSDPVTTFYCKNLGGGIIAKGSGLNYSLQLSHSVPRHDPFLSRILQELDALGFIPPLDEAGEPHPAVTKLLEQTFSVKKHFPCKIPPEKREPLDIVVSFINVMYAFEEGLQKWNAAGYPHSLAMQLCAKIAADLCVPDSRVVSFGSPSQYAPKKEVPQQIDSTQDSTEVTFRTEVGDQFKHEHKFVVRQHEGIWKLAEVWSESKFFRRAPDRIL